MSFDKTREKQDQKNQQRPDQQKGGYAPNQGGQTSRDQGQQKGGYNPNKPTK